MEQVRKLIVLAKKKGMHDLMKSLPKSLLARFGFTLGIIGLQIFFAPMPYADPDFNRSPIHADARVNTAALTVGDVLTFTVAITADPDIQLDPIDFNPFFNGFEVIDNGLKKPEMVDDQIRTEYWYRLRADKVGKYTIPSVPITFIAPDPQYPTKTIQGQILTPGVNIEILSILRLQGDPTDIHDIKPILEMAPDWQRYALYGLILLVALAALLIWVQKKQKSVTPKSLQPSPLLPHERAMLELKTLQTKKLLSKQLYREHYFELSEIFRRYLGNRFQLPALDWTSQEITGWLETGRILTEPLREKVETILDHTDQVKFAKAEPSSFISDKTIDSIYQFINATKEIPQPLEPQRQSAL